MPDSQTDILSYLFLIVHVKDKCFFDKKFKKTIVLKIYLLRKFTILILFKIS